MKRKVYNRLVEWKKRDNGKSAILIEGARRIGKSYIAEEFGRNEYDSYILIDFSSVPSDISELFSLYVHDLDMIFERLQLFYNKTLIERKSLIIFDEIQFCPKARAAIKHLVADGRYDYIETGSLISIKRNVEGILLPSEEETIEMYPMDFEEFLWAMNDNQLMPYIRKQFESKKAMGDAFHRRAMDAFRKYMIVGGMPQAVEAYVEKGNLNEVEEIKHRIINLYRNDIKKYGGLEGVKAAAIFDEIPGQLQRHEKKFRLSSIRNHAKMRDYSDAFFWLSDAKIVNCCYNSTSPNLGLRLNEDRTTLKCYMGDTGLLISLAYDESGNYIEELYRRFVFDKLEVNNGMLTENMVAQMLVAAGHKLYFYANSDRNDADNRMEIDFLISKSRISSRHNISPIEVKSGSRYTLTSLTKCINKYGPYLSTPYVIHDKDLKIDSGITYIPIYMTPLL